MLLSSTIPLENIALAKSTDNVASEQIGNKNNLVILNDDLENYVYTYEENGISFKAIEHISSDLKHVDGEIYQKDKNGNYKLYSTLITDVKDGIVTTKTNNLKNHTITIEKMDLTPIIERVEKESEAEIDFADIESEVKTVKISSDIGTSDYSDLGPWEHHTTDYGKKGELLKVSLGTLITVIGALCLGSLSSILAKAALAGVQYIANYIVNHSISTVYYKKVWYFKYIKGTKFPRAEKVNTTFYKNKDRTKQIGDTVVQTYYVSGYEP